ncbi:hypothetical protein PILCRDRAFT_10291 [Piloderma croceum F 1598]|uniref:Uncharacterized protein n=1 Tax=Piloderma croceum (strain F 1598) TaxID=765440 RepID=A0A0C3FI57_PILCF|nr:hypothetical protein PILCRDRAFT_10291 [Piloderma croceum F 1598]
MTRNVSADVEDHDFEIGQCREVSLKIWIEFDLVCRKMSVIFAVVPWVLIKNLPDRTNMPNGPEELGGLVEHPELNTLIKSLEGCPGVT